MYASNEIWNLLVMLHVLKDTFSAYFSSSIPMPNVQKRNNTNNPYPTPRNGDEEPIQENMGDVGLWEK